MSLLKSTVIINVILLMFLLIIRNANGLDPLVKTNVGLIKGLEAADGDYSMFLGIPYAKVDLDNPFGSAMPYPTFNETFEAYDDSVKCPQFDDSLNIGVGSLDCLNLNIHVPNSANSKNILPVMIFIHGGSLSTGYGGRYIYGPKFLVRHDVILVTLNYRVGVYGFMCLGTPEIPGNQGLKDQLIALKWINANIKSFGGDPDRITLFGQSAGARSVDFHLMANSENLFSKAILQSGNSISSPSISTVNNELPITLAQNLGFAPEDINEALAFLTKVEPKLLVSAAYIIVGPMFQVCVENESEGVDGYVTDFTINRNVTKVRTTPILIGFNNNEKFGFHALKENSFYNNLDFFSEFLTTYFELDDKELVKVQKLVRTFYIGDAETSVNVKKELADFDSDFTYIHPIKRGINQYISNGATKIYQYMFSYVGDRNNLKDISGAIHSDELSYLFDLQKHSEIPNPTDQVMIDRMTTMWTNFAKFGDPTPDTSELLPEKWQPITDSNWYYYDINMELSLRRRPLNRRMSFLDLLFKANQHLQKGLQRNS